MPFYLSLFIIFILVHSLTMDPFIENDTISLALLITFIITVGILFIGCIIYRINKICKKMRKEDEEQTTRYLSTMAGLEIQYSIQKERKQLQKDYHDSNLSNCSKEDNTSHLTSQIIYENKRREHFKRFGNFMIGSIQQPNKIECKNQPPVSTTMLDDLKDFKIRYNVNMNNLSPERMEIEKDRILENNKRIDEQIRRLHDNTSIKTPHELDKIALNQTQQQSDIRIHDQDTDVSISDQCITIHGLHKPIQFIIHEHPEENLPPSYIEATSMN